jgi:hypothetical protein
VVIFPPLAYRCLGLGRFVIGEYTRELLNRAAQGSAGGAWLHEPIALCCHADTLGDEREELSS